MSTNTRARDRQALLAALDILIADHLDELEARIRRDLDATGPESDVLLDAPPVPESDWELMTVEQIVGAERFRLEQVRNLLAECRAVDR